jgi:hypothetical protein
MLSFNLINILTFVLLGFGIYRFFRDGEEIPLLILLFFLLTGIRRYAAVQLGLADWVYVKYSFDIFTMDEEKAQRAMNLFFMGTALFVAAFYFFYNRKGQPAPIDDNDLFHVFLYQKRYFILILFGLFFVLNSATSNMMTGSVALGNSYFYLFKLAIGGLILLLFMLFRSSILRYQFLFRLILLALIGYAAFVSFNPYLRFQFLSWAIALGILFLGDRSPVVKIRYYVIGGVLILFFFSLAGVARTMNLKYLSLKERIELSKERTTEATDQNMLDGFMMVLDVYPHHLPHTLGMEHFEILLRPIPRRWWPNKPLGGYANKLGLNDPTQGTVGISQSIYGTFFGEGGFVGIIVFSILYGWFFVRMLRYSEKFNSDMRWLVKGILLASLLPILRGGDLPGIIAFVGMGFWPAFLFIFMYHNYLKKTAYEQMLLSSAEDHEGQQDEGTGI